MRIRPVIFTVIFAVFSTAVFAQDVRFEASLERNTVSVGNPIYLYLSFDGTQDMEVPDVPQSDGLRIKYVGPSTEISIVNGKVSKSITHTYLVMPLKKGNYDIGPFSVSYKGDVYRADAVPLAVNDVASQVSAPSAPQARPFPVTPAAAGAPVPATYDDNVFLRLEVPKTRVYINEIIPVSIGVYVDGVGLKDIEYPVYSHEGFSAGEFEKPERQWKVMHGTRYDMMVFRQNVFGIKEGDYTLGPAGLSCKVVSRGAPVRASVRGSAFSIDDFFSSRFGSGYNVYPIEIQSDTVRMTILPFPKKGRPPDFKGAVGDFRMNVDVTPSGVKVGDPLTVRISISGSGNFDTVTAPQIMSEDKFKTYEPQVTKKFNEKIYEQIIVPKSAGMDKVPAVSFSFFNPQTERYETIVKGPFPVEVAERPEGESAVKMVSMPGKESMLYPEEKLGRDIVYIKENMGPLSPGKDILYRKWTFWPLELAPLLAFALFFVNYRKKKRMMKDESYARFLKAPRKARRGLAKAASHLARGDIIPFYDVIFRTLQEYLGGRFSLPKGNITSDVIEELLRPAKADEGILAMLRDTFARCEMARYASSVPGGQEADKVLEDVRKIIDYMEKVKIV